MSSQLKVLVVNLQPEILALVKAVIPESQLFEVHSVEAFEEHYDQWAPADFDLLLCGLGWEILNIFEIGQNLRMKFRSTPMVFAAPQGMVQDRDLLKKNGFVEFFYWPMDIEYFSTYLRNLERVIKGITKEVFVSVSTYNLEADQVLDFDLCVYFPLNDKYIKVSQRGQCLSSQQITRLKERSVSQVFIPESQLANYHNYVARLLKEYSKNPDQTEKLVDTIRNLFHDLLSPGLVQLDEGRDLADQARKIVLSLLPTSTASDLHEELTKKTGDVQAGLYRRSQKVATIAGLLALKIGHKAPEDVVLAGLFCDLGSAGVSDDLHHKDRYQMTPDEKLLADSHINLTLQILGEKRVSIVPAVRQAIQQHHERFDGSGYPLGIKGHKISQEAQILALATQIESLTTLRPGHSRVSPTEALDCIGRTGTIDPQLVRQIKIFVQPRKLEAS